MKLDSRKHRACKSIACGELDNGECKVGECIHRDTGEAIESRLKQIAEVKHGRHA